MSQVTPFRALRPRKALAGQVAARPYDVLEVVEARQLVRDNPLSFLHVEKSEIDVAEAAGVEDPRIYERARDSLRRLRDEGVLVQDPLPAFYLYRQCMGGRTQTGIVACVSVDEYRSGKIRRHEWTRADKERERTLHIDRVGAQTGPVFLTYQGQERIDRLVAGVVSQPPEYDFTSADGVAHTVWIIADPAAIREVEEGFAPVPALYIADGHHRAAAAATVAGLRDGRFVSGGGEHRRMLAVLFPHDQLRIMDYNRAVRDLNGLTRTAFLERVGERFLVTSPFAEKAPARAHEFGMYLGGGWHRLTARPEIRRDADPVAGLDVSLLQEELLGPVLGIGDPRTDERIRFIGGIRGMVELERLVDAEGYAAAFSLYPPTIGQMMAVADAGQVMPPKSTWFEPKLLSGLFVHLLE